jgi:hypothetical protein
MNRAYFLKNANLHENIDMRAPSDLLKSNYLRMKRLVYKVIPIVSLALVLITWGCEKTFLDKPPLGSLTSSQLANKEGVNGLLTGAYSLLDGSGSSNVWEEPFDKSVSDWVFGGVASDDAHKGSSNGDVAEIEQVENYTSISTLNVFNDKWILVYGGVERSNDVLKVLALVKDGSITPSEATEITAEARFLRGYYHFEGVKMWRNIPYIDEKVTYSDANFYVLNSEDIYPKIEADFSYAIANLPEQTQLGRVNVWAAKAFLAKVYMFEHKYPEAKELLTDIIANGKTCSGQKYALGLFHDNFDALKKNGSEAVFAVQMTVNDGSNGMNGNAGDLYNGPADGPTTCCGFYQPSFSLANSYKTDADGLPLLDNWNDFDITNDEGLASSDPFTPYQGNLDPRIDWTVGRRGIPYLDWGIMSGASWIRSEQGGPYVDKKNMYYKANQATTSETFGGWGANQSNSINFNIIRFSDIILCAAECEVEIGSLAQAEIYVNMVRNRAADPAGWVQTDQAHYVISPYNGQFAGNGKDYARKAVRFERKLELAMEGHRFFDLQRYDNGSGYMADVLNAYIQHETHIPGFNYQILTGASFTKGKNELYPIPQAQIDLSKGTLKQNQGYN